MVEILHGLIYVYIYVYIYVLYNQPSYTFGKRGLYGVIMVTSVFRNIFFEI